MIRDTGNIGVCGLHGRAKVSRLKRRHTSLRTRERRVFNAYLRIPMQPVQEEVHGHDEYKGARLTAGQVPKVRWQEGGPTHLPIRRYHFKEKLNCGNHVLHLTGFSEQDLII